MLQWGTAIKNITALFTYLLIDRYVHYMTQGLPFGRLLSWLLQWNARQIQRTSQIIALISLVRSLFVDLCQDMSRQSCFAVSYVCFVTLPTCKRTRTSSQVSTTDLPDPVIWKDTKTEKKIEVKCTDCPWFQASAAMLRSALFWGITRRRVVNVGLLTLEMGPIRCSEMSVNNYHSAPRNIAEERRCHAQTGLF
jgi:hypothetical protein